MSLLFDHVLEQGMQLDIYDRKSGSGGKNFRFPARYEPYIHPGVPYPELPALLGRYEYALNVNSVTDSQTMCSRRVLQIDEIVGIENERVSLQTLFQFQEKKGQKGRVEGVLCATGKKLRNQEKCQRAGVSLL